MTKVTTNNEIANIPQFSSTILNCLLLQKKRYKFIGYLQRQRKNIQNQDRNSFEVTISIRAEINLMDFQLGLCSRLRSEALKELSQLVQPEK